MAPMKTSQPAVVALRARRAVELAPGPAWLGAILDEPVDPAVADRVLATANRAPSAGFSQGYALLVLDVAALARPVLRHRILTNFTATSEGITPDVVIERLIKETPSRDGELTKDERFKKIFAS